MPCPRRRLRLGQHVRHSLGSGQEGVLAGDLVEQGAAPPHQGVGRFPHAFTHGHDQIVQFDGGVEVIDIAGLFERAGKERRRRAQVAVRLT